MTTTKTYDRLDRQKRDLAGKLQELEWQIVHMRNQSEQGRFDAKHIQHRTMQLVTASVQMLELIAEIVAQEQVIADAHDASYQSEMAEIREAVSNDLTGV
jgi:hypothetical protein